MEEKKLKPRMMALLDLPKYTGEWPQVAQVKEQTVTESWCSGLRNRKPLPGNLAQGALSPNGNRSLGQIMLDKMKYGFLISSLLPVGSYHNRLKRK
ncbi:MAG: hypothetical protein AB2705_00610 [Candidatus Thiodiazotropha sp.]